MCDAFHETYGQATRRHDSVHAGGMACIAFLILLFKWAIDSTLATLGREAQFNDVMRTVVAILPWGIGVSVGIVLALRRRGSPFWGAIKGGCLGAGLWPFLPCVYLWMRGMNAVSHRTVLPMIPAAILFSAAMGAIFSGCLWATQAMNSQLSRAVRNRSG